MTALMAFPRREERRLNERLQLRWPVAISAGRTSFWIETTTENLSCRGFYCICRERLRAEQKIDCRLSLPDVAARRDETWIHLLCRATVVSVEPLEEGFGVGCLIEDFTTVGPPPRPTF